MTDTPAHDIAAHFDRTTGVLDLGPALYKTDEVEIHAPWTAGIEDLALLGNGSPERQHLLAELTQLVEWLWQACGDDPPRIWLRGSFGSTLWSVVEELDVVVIYEPDSMSAADRWVLRLLTAGHVELHPARMTVTALRHDDTWAIDREARRSAVRVTDPQTGRVCKAGWIQIVKGGG